MGLRALGKLHLYYNMEKKNDFDLKKGMSMLLMFMLCISLMGIVAGQGEPSTAEKEERIAQAITSENLAPGLPRVVTKPKSWLVKKPKAPLPDTTSKGLSDSEDSSWADALRNSPVLGAVGSALFNVGSDMAEGIGSGIENIISGGTPSTGETSSDTTPSTDMPNPEAFCPEENDEIVDFNSSALTASFAGDDVNKDDFRDQWCAFSNIEDSTEKNAEWKALSDGQKKKFMDAMGKQYGTSISGLEKGTWDGKDLVVGGKKINMDFEKYYGDDNADSGFDFRGNDHKYNRKNIRSIDANKDGDVTIGFGGEDEGKDASSLTLRGDADFDPETMKITAGGKEYDWNGQGTVDFGEGKLKMNFAPGQNNNDVTNFPIMRMDDGTEVSPFQKAIPGADGKDYPGLEKAPSSGFTVSDDGKYTIDSNGNVYEIKNSEVTIDKTSGEVKAVKDGYINKESLKGDVFASGEYGIGEKGDYKSYFNLDGDKLTIVSDGNDVLHYNLETDLAKLDVSGSGKTYIRNGDYLMRFTDGGILSVRPLPDGKYGHTVQEIVNVNDAKNPFKLIKGEDDKIALMDSSGKAIVFDENGKVKVPPKKKAPREGKTPGEGGSAEAIADAYLKDNGDGTYTLESQNYVEVEGIGASRSSVVTEQTLTIKVPDDIPDGLTPDEYLNYIIENGDVDFELNFVSDEVTKASVKQSLIDNDAPGSIVSLVENNIGDEKLNGKKLTFKLRGKEPEVTYTGKENPNIDIGAAKSDIISYLGNQMTPPPPTIPGKAVIKEAGLLPEISVGYVVKPQYRKDGKPVKNSARDIFYAQYKSS